MELTIQQIEELASRPDVRRIAVENFLMSLDDLTHAEAVANLHLDAGLYKWNSQTKKAIREGIKLYYGR